MILTGLSAGIALSGLIILISFFSHYQNRFYPGVHIDEILVSNLTQDEALALLQNKQEDLSGFQIELTAKENKLASSSAELELHRNYAGALQAASKFGREKNPIKRLLTIWRAQTKPVNFTSNLEFSPNKTKEMALTLAQQVNTPYRFPSAKLSHTGSTNSLKIDAGLIGEQVEIEATTQQILQAAAANNIQTEAKIKQIGAKLNQGELTSARQRAAKFVSKQLIFEHDDISSRLNDLELVELLSFPTGYSDSEIELKLDKIAREINRAPQDAKFDYNPESLEIKEFQPHKLGLELNREQTKQQLLEFLLKIDEATETTGDYHYYQIQAQETQPTLTLENTNDLGIKELVGFGDSFYEHSIPSRIHNVQITAEKINNTLIPPGAEFSFNQTLGEVSRATGYQSAYVIQGGKTVLGDGGGVCQASTTVFRAALDAGVKITRRLPHSYRVSYYELNSKPGIDATVYAGNVDLRFINDTPGYLLLRTSADSENVYMKAELYGTSDGRTAEITNHRTWGYQPPLPTQYIPSADLPYGVKKQVDWSVSGIKAEFTHINRNKDGQVMSEKTYQSNYQPWSAKYLIGL